MLSRTFSSMMAVAMALGCAAGVRAQDKPADPPKNDAGGEKEKSKDDAGEEIDLRKFVYSTDEAIDLFLARIKSNPNDDVTYQRLGEMYERKAAMTGDLACYEKAEAALRKALELFPESHRSQVSLAAVLCTRHKFTEGLELARKALKRHPKDVDALATAGDALLETGRYAEAEKAYDDLFKVSKLPPVLSRLANLADLKGETDKALQLMKRAAEEILKTGGSARDAGWFFARQAEIALNAGRIDEAEKLYASVPPGIDAYHDATAGLGRIRAMRGKDDEAIELYVKAVAIGPDPHMLAALGDLYLKAGQPDRAAPLFEQLLKRTEGKAEYLRERAMFLANHDRDLPRALALAEEDLLQRKDVYGYDALAWALYKNGRAEDASRAMAEALKLGTKDANLDYHAGMIHHRLQDREKAKMFLAKALSLNPAFDPRRADEARKTLEAIGRERP